MAKYVGFGIDEYIAKLENLGIRQPEICKKAVWDGAWVVADAIRANMKNIPVVSGERSDYLGSEDKQIAGITATQKEGLLKGFGIAKIKDDGGTWNTHVGFHGYNNQKTTKYKSGQPNAMIARSVEGGTSFRKKLPFVAPAVRKNRTAAEAKMKETIEEETKKIMGG